MPTLRDLTAGLDATVDGALGDTITYTPAGGYAATLSAWVEFDPETVDTLGSKANVEVVVIEVPRATIAAPSRDDRVTIALRPGVTYAPLGGWKVDVTGAKWRMTLGKVAS